MKGYYEEPYVRNGWYHVHEYAVYVINNEVRFAKAKDGEWGYVYTLQRNGEYVRKESITLDGLRISSIRGKCKVLPPTEGEELPVWFKGKLKEHEKDEERKNRHKLQA